jgi:hypothetical protein
MVDALLKANRIFAAVVGGVVLMSLVWMAT